MLRVPCIVISRLIKKVIEMMIIMIECVCANTTSRHVCLAVLYYCSVGLMVGYCVSTVDCNVPNLRAN